MSVIFVIVGGAVGAAMLLGAFFWGLATGRGERMVFVPRYGVWSKPSAKNAGGATPCWHRRQVVVGYNTRAEASVVAAALSGDNEFWDAEVRDIPDDELAVPARLLLPESR